MAENRVESCDCCGKVVAETGFKGDTEEIYRRRIKLWEWITGSWLGWRLVDRGWQTICGECWERIGKEVARAALTEESESKKPTVRGLEEPYKP